MKIIFDSGVMISFSESCLLPVLGTLREYLGEFIIPKKVKDESIDRSAEIMRFRLSSLRIRNLLQSDVFDVYDGGRIVRDKATKILSLTNNMFFVRGNPLNIIHPGEAECLALIGATEADCLAIDERTTRTLIEQPYELVEIFKRKYNTHNIKFDESRYAEFKKEIGKVDIIRSIDILAYAYQHKLLGNYVPDKDTLKAAMYSLKFKGCSVSFEEIEEYIKKVK
jgi:hypothetical protein